MRIGHKCESYWSFEAAEVDGLGLNKNRQSKFAIDVDADLVDEQAKKAVLAKQFEDFKSLYPSADVEKYQLMYLKRVNGEVLTVEEKELMASFIKRFSARSRIGGPDESKITSDARGSTQERRDPMAGFMSSIKRSTLSFEASSNAGFADRDLNAPSSTSEDAAEADPGAAAASAKKSKKTAPA
jgi:hypothetical protein